MSCMISNMNSLGRFHSSSVSFRTYSAASHPKARVVVVGAGRMGQIRASLLRGNPRFDVCCIVDINLEGAQALADKYGVSYQDWAFA